MTHAGLYSVRDGIDALDAALENENLSLIQRQVLRDMRDDLERATEINTFSDVVELALQHATQGYY
ncbi:MAG: hypothetical protein AAFX07_00710 [Pseudomonadota bacterium]